MSFSCSCGSHLSVDGSCGGSGLSDLSALGRFDPTSIPTPCSLSDLDDYNDLKRSHAMISGTSVLIDRRSERLNLDRPSIKETNIAECEATVDKETENRKRKEGMNSMVNFNIQSRKDFSPVEKDLQTKSSKKRSSLGLGFNIQIFKGARQRFNKKKSDVILGSQSTTTAKKIQNKKDQVNSQTSFGALSDFFPQVIVTTISQNLTQSFPPAVNTSTFISTTFDSIPSRYSPVDSFLPISNPKEVNWKRNVNKFAKSVKKKTNIENGGEPSKNLKLENGNYCRRGDPKLKISRDILSSGDVFLPKHCHYFEENHINGDCFCHLTSQNRKTKQIGAFSKLERCHPLGPPNLSNDSSSSEYGSWRRTRILSPAHQVKRRVPSSEVQTTEGNLKIPNSKMPLVTSSSESIQLSESRDENFQRKDFYELMRKSFASRNMGNESGSEILRLRNNTTSMISSTDHYDVTSDEEGDVDTSITSSDEGLTSNLSLFTSAEGDEDAIGVTGENFYQGVTRGNIYNMWALFNQDLGSDDVTPCGKNKVDKSQITTKWNENRKDRNKNFYLTHETTPALPTVTITTTTSKTTATTVTTTSKTSPITNNKKRFYAFKNVLNNKFLSNKPENFAQRKFNSKLELRGENNYLGKWYLATQPKGNASVGISSKMINNELGVREDLPPSAYLRGYLPHFPSNLMREKPLNKSRNLSHVSYSNLKGKNNKSEVPFSALASMKGDIVELSTKLEIVSREKELFEASLTNAQLAHARAERETSAKLDNVTQQYEERITELHSVIAELTRKLDRQRDDVILEEDEDEENDEGKVKRRRGKARKDGDEEKISLSEFSSQEQNETTECSTSETADSEALFDREEQNGDTNLRPPTDISTSCEIDDRAVEAGECIADLDVSGCRGTSTSNLSTSHPCNDNATDDVITDDVMCQGSSSVGLEEEVKVLREENTNLQQALVLAQHKVTSQKSAIMALSREREILRKKVKEFERMQPGIPLSSPQISDAIMVRGLRGSPFSGALLAPAGSGMDTSVHASSRAASPSVTSYHHDDDSALQDGVKVICKLAERVRLKKAENGDLRVTGSDLSSVGVSTTGVAEQLAAGVQEESDAQELFHALATAGGAFAPHERLKEYELEAERLHARIDHLRAQNEVLCATLSESKACCDRLALKTGRAEAQSGALKMGVEVLNQIQEAFEVLTALHEAQIALLVVTCQVTGVDLGTEMGFEPGDQDVDPLVRVKRVQEQRRTAENVARHLLSRLQEQGSTPCNALSETNGIHSMSSSTSGFSSKRPHQEEHILRTAISRLQEERTRILSCIKGGVESPPSEDYFPSKLPLNDDEAHKLDLENAVLMQELTAIREDRAELRAQVYLLEREKAGLELRIGTCEAQAAAYCVTIDHLKSQLNQLKGQNISNESVGDSGVDTASSEAESLRRENQLKTRVEDLVMTLEKVTKNSEARHRQSQEFISDLKKANSALLTAVDRLKKKYTLRVKRMEQQTTNLVAKHEQQVKAFKHRITTLEEQLRGDTHSPHQASSAGETNF